MSICPTCGKETNGKKFCDKKCFDIYNIKKNKEEYTCEYCGKIVKGKANYVKHTKYCIKNPQHIEKKFSQKELDHFNYIGKCEFCGIEIKGKASLGRHRASCKNNPNRKYFPNRKHMVTSGNTHKFTDIEKEHLSQSLKKFYAEERLKDYRCRFCNKKISSKVFVKRHEKYCELNPNREEPQSTCRPQSASRKGNKKYGWSKGLTKETSESIRKCIATRKENIRTGKTIIKGHPQSEASKEKLRQARLAQDKAPKTKRTEPFLKRNGDVVYLDSSFERKLANILEEENIDWIRPSYLPWVDKNGMERKYYADFFLTKYNIYLDPKNDFCFEVQSEKINYILSHYNNVFFLHFHEITKETIYNIINKRML